MANLRSFVEEKIDNISISLDSNYNYMKHYCFDFKRELIDILSNKMSIANEEAFTQLTNAVIDQVFSDYPVSAKITWFRFELDEPIVETGIKQAIKEWIKKSN